jgi:succinate-semialdehyde dehydrogenase / glutarate-semialdehyde dehydrogenase
LTMLFLANLLEQAGAPAGTVNVVTTSSSSALVAPLLKEGLVRHLSFTGSTFVGSKLHAQCSDHMIRTSLELGGNAPFIVFDDVDLDSAVAEITAAKMRNMGEACTAANRILVHESIADEVTARLTEKFASLRLGNGLEVGTDIGPMIDGASVQRIQALVDDAVSRGAEVCTGGAIPDGVGSFYPPTVLANVPRDARLMQEEIFGPVAPIIPFSDEEDAVALANDTAYGLAGYLMTNDLARAHRVARRMEVGMVGINSGIISDVAAPLGGVKASGIGREGGVLGIDEFLEYKYTFIPHQ